MLLLRALRVGKAGYVRNREEYKSLAQAALTTSGRGYFRARVKEVIISAEGYFFVEAETDSTPIVPILHKDHWKEWEKPAPAFISYDRGVFMRRRCYDDDDRYSET